MADTFRMNPGAIDRIAKSSEIKQLCLGAADAIAAVASGIMPEATYKTDVITGQRRARARVRAMPPGWDDARARKEFYAHPPIFGIQPRI